VSIFPSLAYAELNTAYAHIVRRFDLINAGTTNEDIDWKDNYVPRFKGNLKVQLKAL
jgi:cytochrome P450